MNRDQKSALVDSLTEKINNSNHIYLVDIGELNAEDTGKLRRNCFEKEVNLIVVKNTLLELAFDKVEGNFTEIYDVLKGHTSLMLSETGNIPAKLIQEFRKTSKKPILKAAFVEEGFYIGDKQLDVLASIKSKEEVIGDIILLLKSPLKNVMSSLQSGSNIITGVIKTLSNKK